MRRVLITLGVCSVLIFSLPLFSAVKKECCLTHFQVMRAYHDLMLALIQKVKAESVEEFEKRYHDKEASTYLHLLRGTLEDILNHYKELGASENVTEDEALVRSELEKVERWSKQIKNAKSAEAKRIVESYDLSL